MLILFPQSNLRTRSGLWPFSIVTQPCNVPSEGGKSPLRYVNKEGETITMLAKLCLLICLASTLSMTGLIWFVQVVHYPLLGRVGPGSFGQYHADHVRKTGPVVAPLMVAEWLTSLALVPLRPPGVSVELAIAGLSMASAAWISTALIQVPLHQQLSHGFESKAHLALVRTNWFRTIVWTLHTLFVLVMTAQAIS